MFIKVHSYSDVDDEILINTKHIIKVEGHHITILGKDGRDVIKVEETFSEIEDKIIKSHMRDHITYGYQATDEYIQSVGFGKDIR